MTDTTPANPTGQTHNEVNAPVAEFPVVGIGASAGGLAAFEAFFSGMPVDVDPGMAFVLVQHLAPDHKSILSELVRRYTRMQVFDVEDGMVVKPNCAYIIPPNYDMAFLQGALHLLEPVAPRGQRLAVDYFFQSLAADQHEHAIGIVLSGTGSDGTLGVRAIKAVGGMVMVQSTASSEFDGMPRSAIATGLADYQLSPAEMPARLMAYAAQAFGKPPRSGLPATPKTEGALKKIYVLLRAQTGHDFSHYKPSTIYRRIERRMAVHLVETIDAYVRYLQQTPAEVEALFRELLIGVTNFFRDPEAFQALEGEAIPNLFTAKSAGSSVRVWSAGCSTGEEAYSLAILLVERMEVIKQSFTVQVFATDIDSRAIATARMGVYPATIAADITPERLARFFSLESGGQSYRVHKGIRDLLVFSEHDLIKDPPFSKLDLISCRNLLIYLDADLQRKLIPMFHYALNPNGRLLLGTSEGIGEFEGLFAVLDRKAKLYKRKDDLLGLQRATLSRFVAPVLATQASQPIQGAQKADFAPKLPLRELMEQALLKVIAPASALVNAVGDIVYLHGRSGMYLEPTAGEVGVQNILKMARDGLRPSLGSALHQAVATQHTSAAPNVRVKTNGHYTQVNVSVHPVPTHPSAAGDGASAAGFPLYLVMLEEAPVPTDASGPAGQASSDTGGEMTPDAQARIEALTLELRTKDEYLQSTHEELESSNEELKSSNEEMQSVNEELQSTNEELETSKEELQSVNEELNTVNTELQSKVVDLSRANNDMNNLLAGTGIGTVFVDFQLSILRFTPAASSIINLIATDVGRPVAHIVSNLVDYGGLVADIKAVLATLVPMAREVQTTQGQWYTLRIQPYRTLDNVIEGAVISFVDISEMVKTREALRKANELLRLAVVVRDATDAITVQDLNGRMLAWNPGAVKLYGWAEAQALAMNVRERIPEGLREHALDKLKRLSQAEVLEPYLTERLTAAGDVLAVSITSTALVDATGKVYAVATTERAKTDNVTGGSA
ncbi:MAG: PAS domain-containing protein [Hylemonella sp.]|nr:PAS domain-containing protein [Hylemonella sp.]